MNVLIVFAHPEPHSFNGAMKDMAVEVLTGAGHDVLVSDLYAMGFRAEGGREDVLLRNNPDFFDYQREQVHAWKTNGFVPELQAEMGRLAWADLVIFQFPLWWFSLPAILKGWVDRVFAMGFAYDLGRAYEGGMFRGKRAMLSFTTGAPPAAYAPGGRNGSLDVLLHHVQHGMLHFVGMDVLPPFVAHSAARVTVEDRAAYLEAYKQRLLSLDTTAPIKFE